MMKVHAQVRFEVPDDVDADTLASLLDAIGRQLRNEDDPRGDARGALMSIAGAGGAGAQCFIRDASVVAFRIGQGAWTWRADVAPADEAAPGPAGASAADGPTAAGPSPPASPSLLELLAGLRPGRHSLETFLAEMAHGLGRAEGERVRQRWRDEHEAVDRLLAGFLIEHPGRVPSDVPVLELLGWNLERSQSGRSFSGSEDPMPRPTVEKSDAGGGEDPGLHKSGPSRPITSIGWADVNECCAKGASARAQLAGEAFTCPTCGRRWKCFQMTGPGVPRFQWLEEQ
jgi:hypothetical protein